MFTRAAKSVVKNLGQRKYYGGEDNLKVTVIGAAGEVGQTLTHFVKNASKLESSTIHDGNPKSRRLMLTAEKSRSSGVSKALKVQDPRTESFAEKSQQKSKISFVSCFANRELDLERTVNELRDKEIKLSPVDGMKKQTETSSERSITSFPLAKTKTTGLMGVLGRVPVTLVDSAASQSRQVGQTSTYTPITTQGWPAYRRNHSLHEAFGKSSQLRWSCRRSDIFFRCATGSFLSATPPMRQVSNVRSKLRNEAIGDDSSLERRIINCETINKPQASSSNGVIKIEQMLQDPRDSLGFYCRSMKDPFIFTLLQNVEPKWLTENSKTISIQKREYSCVVSLSSSTCRLNSILEPLEHIRHLPIPYEYSLKRSFKSVAIGMLSVCAEYVGKTVRIAQRVVEKIFFIEKPTQVDLLKLWKRVDNFVVSSLKAYEELPVKKDQSNWLEKFAVWRSAKRTEGKIAYLDKFLVAGLHKIRVLKNRIEMIERSIERELRTR